MDVKTFLPYLLVMVAVTYLIRVLPYVFMRKEVKSEFLKSFLGYVPYTVLAAMTFPVILDATGSPLSAGIGFVVAVVAAYFNLKLLPVALLSCLAVLVTELLMLL
ncbi:MAG: AzlD domain-containing protein [Lachnospiraceae bacterium]|nr:AzlD domain-containing protein [Lachnospiraceae bacterium]